MPPSNPSGVSNSAANSVRFRQRILSKAGIYFHLGIEEMPASAQTLSTYITAFDDNLDRCRTLSEVRQNLSDPSMQKYEDYQEALERAARLRDQDVSRCSMQHERRWMMKVNEPVLQLFEDGVSEGLLSVNSDYEWANGRDLMHDRRDELNNPKPDMAYGLAAAVKDKSPNRADWDPLSISVLEELACDPAIRLIYSPSEREDIIFPALIYEAKSDSNPILWAENQAAVGAARALAILEDLRRVSGLGEESARPTVVCLASAGPLWRVFIAMSEGARGLESSEIVSHEARQLFCKAETFLTPVCALSVSFQHIYPVHPGFLISDEMQRFRLQVILVNLRRWLLGTYKDFVTQQLKAIWQQHLIGMTRRRLDGDSDVVPSQSRRDPRTI